MPKPDPECVRVVVRSRPMSRTETEDQRKRVVNVDHGTGTISVRNPKADSKEPPKQFTFDSVYDQNSTQKQIYDETARPIVESTMQGYNGTIFAYGQTGTGKTHTMEGKDDPKDQRGIIPNAFQHIFEAISMTEGDQEFLVRASFLEIYNEEIRDLLSKDSKGKLDLKEDVERGVYVKGLTSFVVKGVSEIDHVMQVGKKNRTVGATLMNVDSSRSHSIFTITIETSARGPDGQNHIRVGKLNLVDLAGSERQGKTGATGQRLAEATKINLSLSALGNVISALVDSKTTHIPYRDSKLTRLLQDSLGGNTKTVMVSCVGPADYNYDETISTLRYANRAKNIKNKPKINEDPKDAMLREFQEEISRLKAKLRDVEGGEGGEGGVVVKEVIKEVIVEVPVPTGGGSVPPGATVRTVAGPDGKPQQVLVTVDENGEEKMVPLQAGASGMDEAMVEEMKKQLEDEKRRLEMEKAETEEEKRKIEQEYLERQKDAEDQIEKERQEKAKLAKKLAAMQSKLVVGGESVHDIAKRQEMELTKQKMELEERARRERMLQQELDDAKDLQKMEEDHYNSLQDEVEEKSKKLKKVWQHYQAAKSDIQDLTSEFQQEREDMLDTIRELNSQLKLKQLVIESFIPPDELNKIERRAVFDEERDEWSLQRQEFAGNNVSRSRRPTSAVGNKRPTSNYAQAQSAMGDSNPRWKNENIINFELDLPERTTHDYAEAIEMGFGDEHLVGFPVEDVYLSYGQNGGDERQHDRPQSGRPKSAARRPNTASRRGNRREKREELSTVVAEEGGEGEEQFPTARGLLSSRGKRREEE